MNTKVLKRKKIHSRIRMKIKGTGSLPRLHVYRSNKAIYGSLINDLDGVTLLRVKSSDVDQEGTKVDIAKKVGLLLGQKALDAGFSKVKFDRGGYLYHGRIKSLAEGAREAGLKF